MHTAISWFVRNPVAANLLMFFLVVCGLLGALVVNQEEFPNIDVRAVSVSVPYPVSYTHLTLPTIYSV